MEYDLNLNPADCIYTHARAAAEHPAFEICAAVDSSPARRAIFERIYGCAAYASVASAAAVVDAELVILATPTSTHLEVLIEVLSSTRPEVILCEKPLSYDLADAKRIVELSDEAGVSLFVNYMRRADVGAIEIKHRIDSGRLHTPVKGVAWYSKGYFHNGSHVFNLLEFWLGPYICSKKLNPGRLWEGLDPEPDILVEFKGGSVIFRSAWEEAFSHYTIELLSHSGRLRYDKGGELIELQSVVCDSGTRLLGDRKEFIPTSMNRYQWQVFEQIAQYFAGTPVTLCSGLEAYTTLEAMHESIIGSEL